ncbi:MAG: hypothetical protein U1A27_14660 [Phycisphaerae bacterium]
MSRSLEIIRILSLVALAAATVSLLSGCGDRGDDESDDPDAVVGGGDKTGDGDTEESEIVEDADTSDDASRLKIFGKAKADAWKFSADVPGGEQLGDSVAAVALPGRMALFTGGYLGTHATKTAYLYSGATNSWRQVSDMHVARNQHRMVRLNDGRVLVLGGDDGESLLDSAELYDPNTEQFTLAPSMKRARNFFIVELLLDGRVLIAGGDPDQQTFHLSAEVYNPTANEFTSIGMIDGDPRASARLPDGRVLMVGSGIFTTAYLFNPNTNQFSPTAGNLHSVHGYFPTATALPDGRVLVAGGYSGDPNASDRTDLYDPNTGMFTEGPHMSVARQSHVAMLMPNGTVMLLGGVDNGDVRDSGDLFDPADDTMTAMTQHMSAQRSNFAGVALIP